MVPWPNLRRQMRLVHTARVLVFIGHMADLARAVACRKAGALAIEAAARMDARDAAYRARGE
jgi:hypothetical protein